MNQMNRMDTTGCLTDELLSLWVDGEVTEAGGVHLDGCADCAERLEALLEMEEGLRGLAVAKEEAPASLRGTLRGLRAHARLPLRWASKVAVGGVTAALVVVTLFLSPGSGRITEALADQAISSHLRAFSSGNGSGCQVESHDPAVLTDWLQGPWAGPVSVPAPVADARLVGARRCQLFGEATPAVVYRTAEAPVTVFLPQPGTAAFEACERSLGTCTEGRDGQTVCVLPGEGGAPMVVVGALSGPQLCEVVGS